MACFLLHNFIRSEMSEDPIERDLDNSNHEEEVHPEEVDYISTVEATTEWTSG